MCNQTFFHDLHKNRVLNETDLSIAAYDIAVGMEFLHRLKIIHRDLKSLNVLLNDQKRATMTGNIGTPHWMAPELLTRSTDYNEKVDVYAYAIILWEIATRKVPYDGMDPIQIIGSVLMNDQRSVLPNNVSPEYLKLIQDCWVKDLIDRPTFSQIVQRFQKTGNITLSGANEEAVKSYIQINASALKVNQANESILIILNSQDYSFQGITQIIEYLEKEGVPGNFEDFWIFVNRIDKSLHSQLYARALVPFLSSPLLKSAASQLRLLSNISKEVILAVLLLLPSGQDEADTDIVVSALKNGEASRVAIHSISNFHLQLAFEVISQQGVDESLRSDVLTVALRSLESSDQNLLISAFRCILGMKETKAIPIQRFNIHINSTNHQISSVALISASVMASQGVSLPIEMIEALIKKWGRDVFARQVVIAS
jgi:serine/threonine protein kinase